MPTTPTQKNALSIIEGFREKLRTRTGVTNLEKDTVTRTILDQLSDELQEHYQQTREVFNGYDPSSARGRDLDVLGESLFGKQRQEATFATVTSGEQNVMLFVESGTFGGINGGGNITIGAGQMTIRSVANNNEFGAVVEYTNTESIILPAGESIQYISARATQSGSASNVGAEVLREHDFEGYQDSDAGGLKVINNYPILNGNRRRSTEAYRFSLQQTYASARQQNQAQIALEVLDVPGVLDYRIIPGYFGIGSVGVIVLGVEKRSSPSLVANVQRRLNAISTPQGELIATGAVEVLFDFKFKIKTKRPLRAQERERLKSNVRKTIRNYYLGVELGGTVDIEVIVDRIKTQNPEIITLSSSSGDSRGVEKVYVRKGTTSIVLSEREVLSENSYVLEDDHYGMLGTTEFSFV